MGIQIVTDSSADLSQELIARYNIKVVPLSVEIGGKIYQDGILKGKDFYDQMDSHHILPKTAAPSPRLFAETFQEIPEKDKIISINISSKLSGTLQSAKLGAQMANRKVSFIDSKAATMGLGILTVYAAELAKLGKGAQDIIDVVHHRIENLKILVFLDTAKNIVKSGRLGKVAGTLVNLLNLKILLTNRDGEIQFLDKMRGKKRVFNRFVQMIEECGHSIEGRIIGISHADNLLDAEHLKKIILDKFKPKEILLTNMGSCIGTHAGRGGITISF